MASIYKIHSIEVNADLNKDVLIFTPAGPATAAAYLQHERQDHKKN